MTLPKAAIARILGTDGDVVGSGFLVANGTVLTCAHVVGRALGPGTGRVPSPGDTVDLDFPLARPVARLRAEVTVVRFDLDDLSVDIAALRLPGGSPHHLAPIRLVETDDVWEHRYRAFGFPPRRSEGIWAKGRLLDKLGNGLVQLAGDEDSDFHIDSGFSGTPLWDEDVEGAVGIVVAKEQAGPGRPGERTAYGLVGTELFGLWPGLRDLARPPCPYRGLKPFRDSDRDVFFGRDTTTRQLAEHLRTHRVVPLIGPSGVGKSSLVSAGLIPALRQRGDTVVATVDPDIGTTPARMLGHALAPLLTPGTAGDVRRIEEASHLADSIAKGELSEIVALLLARHEAEQLVVVIDQFESLLGRNGDAGPDLIGLLLPLTQRSPAGRPPCARVLFVLRLDYTDPAMNDPRLVAAWRTGQFLLTALQDDQLRQAIERPAAMTGAVTFEDGLTERILADAGSGPAELPLVEFVLTLLWEQQQRGVLTNASYQNLGGVGGALARYAEDVWTVAIDDARGEEDVARLFAQLVRPGEGGLPDTRLPARRSDLDPRVWDVAEQLVTTRLLVPGHTADGEQTVELAHEALIERWSRLKGWIDADRSFRGWQEDLRRRLRIWESHHRDTTGLLDHVSVAAAEGWLQRRLSDISAAESEFIQASRRRLTGLRRIRRAVVATLVVLALLAVGGLTWSLVAHQRLSTSQAAQLSRTLAAAAPHQDDPVTRALLAVAAYRTSPTPQAADAVLAQYLQRQYTEAVMDTGRIADAVDMSADARTVAFELAPTGSAQDPGGTVQVWSLPPGPAHRRLLMTVSGTSAMALSRDGTLLAVGGNGGRVRLFDVRRTTLITRFTVPHDPAQTNTWVDQLRFDPQGRHLAATVPQARYTLLWDLGTRAPTRLVAPGSPPGVARLTGFSPDGRTFFAASSAGPNGPAPQYGWRTSDGAPAGHGDPVRDTVTATSDGTVAARCQPGGGAATGRLALLDPLTRQAEPGLPQGIPCTGATTLLDVSAHAVLTADHDPASLYAPPGGTGATEDAAAGKLQLWDRATGAARATLPMVPTASFYRLDDTGARILTDGTYQRSTGATQPSQAAAGSVLSLLAVPPHDGLDPLTGVLGTSADLKVLGFSGPSDDPITARGQHIDVWSRGTGRLLGSTTAPAGIALPAPAVGPGGTVLAALLPGGTAVRVYRLPSLRPVKDIPVPQPRSMANVPQSLQALSFCSDHTLAVLNAGTITVWNTAKATLLAPPMVFSADAAQDYAQGSVLMTALCRPGGTAEVAIPSRDGRAVELWNAGTRGRVGLLSDGTSQGVTPSWFSADGRYLLTVNSHDEALWRVDTGRKVATLSPMGNTVTAAAGRFPVAFWSTGGTTLVRLDAGGHTTGLTFPSAIRPAVTATSPDGSVLLLDREDLGAQSLLPGDPAQWADRLCTMTGRSLTTEEIDSLPTDSRPHAGCS